MREQVVDAWLDHRAVHRTCSRELELALDDRGEHLGRAAHVVVAHHVAEPVRLLELAPRERDPLADLAGRLGRPLAEAPLELRHVGSDEDRDRARDLVLHVQRALELELEDADAALLGDPVDLRAQRPVPLARDVLHVLEERVPPRSASRNSASSRNQYSRPCSSPGRCGRVVAETATSSSGSRSTSARISVPLPAPEGPVITKTRDPGHALAVRLRGSAQAGPSPVVEEVDELGALPLGEPADGLRLADAALVQQPRRLDATELRHRHQHVEHLGRRDVVGRVEQDLLDLGVARP